MSDRLLGIAPYVFVAGLLGLVAAIALYGAGLGVRLPDYPLGKAEITEKAREFAASQGIDPRGTWTVAQTKEIDRDMGEALAMRLGVADFRQLARSGELPVPAWVVRVRGDRWTSSWEEDEHGVAVTMSETGEVLGADFYAGSKKGSVTRDDARRVALERLAALGVDLTGYAERANAPNNLGANAKMDDEGIRITFDTEEEREQQRKRAEEKVRQQEKQKKDEDEDDDGGEGNRQRFVWERADGRVPGLKVVIAATVNASGLTKFSREMKLDDAQLAPGTVSRIVEGTIYVIVVIFLVVSLLGVLLMRLITRDFVSVVRAGVVAILYFGTVMLSGALATDMSMSIAGLFAASTVLGLATGLLVFSAWLAGEADAYFAWGRQCTQAALAVLMLRLNARQAARETVEGYLWGWAMLGALAIVAASVAAVAGPDAVHHSAKLAALDVHPTFLFGLSFLPYIFFFAVVCLLFVPAWFRRILRKTWLAIPAASVVIALFAVTLELADVRFGSLPGTLSWGLAFGAGVCMLTVKRGWLAAAAATYSFAIFSAGLAATTAGAAEGRIASASGLALATLPALAAFVVGQRLREADIREAPPTRVSKMMEQARREEELSIARRVQSNLLPASDPELSGFEIAGTCRPANEVGGDYFDYFRFPDGRFGVAVGDVSGKGVPAAFCMTLTKGFMEVAAAEAREPEAVLAKANGYLRDNIARDTFVTMTYAVLDPESRTVVWARAGHNPPAVLRDGERAELVCPPGAALGAADHARFGEIIEERRTELRRGDVLVFYTDGVTEAMNPAREQFGEERLVAALERLRDGRSARGLVEDLLSEIAEHSLGASQHDDITIVVIKAA